MNRFYTYYHKLSSPPIQRKKRSRKKFGLRRVFQLLQYFKCLVGRIYQRSLMEIGKLSSLPIILLRIIRGNNYDFTLRPEIILNLSNAHSNGKKKGKEKKKKRRSIGDATFSSREILPWKDFHSPAKRGHFLDNNKKKKEKERRERSCHLSRLSFNFQLLETKNDEWPGNRSNRTTSGALVSSTDSIGMFREERSSTTRSGLTQFLR